MGNYLQTVMVGRLGRLLVIILQWLRDGDIC